MSRILIKLNGIKIDACVVAPDDVADAYIGIGYIEVDAQPPIDCNNMVDGEYVTRPSGLSPRFELQESGEWVDTTPASVAAEVVVSQRNSMLAASDWTQLPDVPLATKEAWATYRQALRDITDQPGYPLELVWPTPP